MTRQIFHGAALLALLWQPVVLADSIESVGPGGVGWLGGLALDDRDNPVLSHGPDVYSYSDFLIIAHCNDINCAGHDDSIAEIFDPGEIGRNSLILDNSGNPVVAYEVYDIGLKILHCNDTNCAGDDESIANVDVTPEISLRRNSMVLDSSGNPVVIYTAYDWALNTPRQLRVLHCNDVNCVGGDESLEVFSQGSDDIVAFSLVLDSNGNPVASVYDRATGDYKIIHCNDVNCAGGDESTQIVDGAGPLTLDSGGNPVVAYHDTTSDSLKILHCNDVNCAGGDESVQTIEEIGAWGQIGGLVLDSTGYPVVSYYDYEYWVEDDPYGDFKLLHCNDVDCAEDDASIQIVISLDEWASPGPLVLDSSGYPVSMYSFGYKNQSLYVVHCNDPNCEPDSIIAVDDGPYVLEEGSALAGERNILDNDTDPDGDPLTPVVVDPPQHASLFQVMPDGTFDYTHDGSETTSDSFTYRASDGLNESEIATVSITINPVNDAPAFIGVLLPGLSTPEDTTLTIGVGHLEISDPDSDPSTFVLTLDPVLPPDANYTLSGPASITPAANFNGDLGVRATVSDGELDSAPFLIPVTVTAENDIPVLLAEIGDQTADRATTFSLDVSSNFSDADGDELVYSANGLPPSLTIDPDTGLVSGTLVQSDLGTWNVTVTARDPSGAFASDSFVLTIVNNDPVFTSTPLTAATEGVLYSYTLTTEDIDSDLVSITGTVVPAWLTLTDNGDGTATLSGTAVGADVGDHPVHLLANDGNTGTTTQQFTITVTASGEGPVITLLGDATVTIAVGDTYIDAGATASDPQDGDLTAQIVVDNPVDTSMGGIYTVTYTVEDSVGNAAQAQRIVIVDGPPIITLIGATTVTLTEGDTYIDAGARAVDREDGDLTNEIVTTNPVDTSRPGTYTVTYTVRDSVGNEAQARRTVIVQAAPPPPPPPPPPPVDQPPTITLNGDATVRLTEGDTHTDAGATASDPEDGDLTNRIVVDNPVDTKTPGTYTVTYTVEDSGGNQAQAERTVIVNAAPPPTQTDRGGGGSGGGAVSPFELLASMLMLLASGRRQRMSAIGC